MKKFINKLVEFHRTFEVNIENKPTIPSLQRCELRQKLIEEEVSELKDAWKNNDLTEVADALADIQYVLLGTVLEFGLQDYFEEIFNEVHRSNMSKLDKRGNVVHRSDGKVMKSEIYFVPNLKKILKSYLP
ncbi:MAG: nucleoside triphosphate pyrophosphohydrolase family protein [Chlorobi bacterium]|nr:nucleoside triphosphate pyrophosphohydrolase family protein [Chlorobiota bacterium]